MKQKTKYFLMTKNEAGQLSFWKDRYVCYPDESWTDACEGIVTDIQIVSTGQDAKSNLCARVSGKMVETEEINWQEVDCMDIYDVYVIAGWTFVAFIKGSKVKEYTHIKGQGLQEVSISGKQWDRMEEEKQAKIYQKLVAQTAPQYQLPGEKAALEVCIRNFAELKLDCTSTVEVFENAFFFVTYPGWYRDSCKLFVVLQDGTLQDTNLARFASKVDRVERREITLEELKLTMDKYGISAGADSGHAVPGVLKEERKLLTTFALPGGGVLVMFKASEFRFDSEVHNRLQSKVTSGLCFWSQRLGEKNEYIGWMD